jgi:hypothetical protein
VASLQRDANAAISATDATPTGFVFDEVAVGLRSNASMDMRFDNIRFDNIEVEYIPGVPESGSAALLVLGAAAAMFRRSRGHRSAMRPSRSPSHLDKSHDPP